MQINKTLKYISFAMALVFGIFITNAIFSFIDPMIEISDMRPVLENTKTYRIKDLLRCKPNPMILIIDADVNQNLILNSKRFGNINDLSILEKELQIIFKLRDEHRLFNEKEIIIVPNKIIKGKNLINLVEMLEKVGANSILIDWQQELESQKVIYSPDIRLKYFNY